MQVYPSKLRRRNCQSMARDVARADIAEASPLLSLLDSETFHVERAPARKRVARQKTSMGIFDNLRGWDKPKKFRYLLLLALSLSGDGW